MKTRKASKQSATQYGLYLLSRRAYSRYDLKQKLVAKDFSVDEVQHALERFDDYGYLDDQHYAHSFVRSKANEHRGPVKISWQLQQKKIATEFITSALEQHDWQSICASAADRKWQQLTSHVDETTDFLKLKQKLYRFLASRGFSSQDIQLSLSSLSTSII